MNSKRIVFFTLMAIICVTAFSTRGSADRFELDLSHFSWGVYRDTDATWIDDELFLPPVDVSALPVNPPSCGWDRLKDSIETTVFLPATIEGEFWGDNGNTRGTGGDYRGVSWWTTSFMIGPEYKGKRLFLDFESVHLRAEVFVNEVLVGYDMIGHTPFSIDFTDVARFGRKNEIAVRITDPSGNFSWNDRGAHRWGKHTLPATHGFGGISGPVKLRVVDRVFIQDVYVLNRPEITIADVFVSVENHMGFSVPGTLTVKILPLDNPAARFWTKTLQVEIDPKGNNYKFSVDPNDVKIWDLDNPNLYKAEVWFIANDKVASDTFVREFGFRWFDIGEKNGDRRLYLNGKRIVLKGGMSWGFWPGNGISPDKTLAEKDVAIAKKMGLNYMNYHRAIGQPESMDAADRMGFLTYEEPGGWSLEGADPADEFPRRMRQVKLLRMVERDRSRPSLIMYNLQNRTPNPVTEEDKAAMHAVHTFDPSRIVTFISGFWKVPPEESPDKLFLTPYSDTENYTGWFDTHNHTPTFGYADHFYNSPTDYLRYTGNKKEIVFWGEDGGLYGAPRLQLIRDRFRNQEPKGWLVQRSLDWYEAWDDFLDENSFNRFFSDVDALTTSLGDVTMYYHGRILENIRAGNLDDGYTINGWAAPNVANQSQVVDLYRNPVGDPEIFAHYAQPLYIAVKARNKVVGAGETVTFDFFVINETGLAGPHVLDVTVTMRDGSEIFRKSFQGNIRGGEEYGQELATGVEVELPKKHGYAQCTARLVDKDGNIIASGSDSIFMVVMDGRGISNKGTILDESGEVDKFLTAGFGSSLPMFTKDMDEVDYIILGKNSLKNAGGLAPMMERVANGATLIVLDGADKIAQYMSGSDPEALEYRGRLDMRKGNFIAGNHSLLSSLPANAAFNWEYQVFYLPEGGPRYGLILPGVKTLIAAVSGSNREIGTALTVVPYGRGNVVLSTLNILPFLNSELQSAYVAKYMMLNYLRFAMQ